MIIWTASEIESRLDDLRRGYNDSWKPVFQLVKRAEIDPDSAIDALGRYLEKNIPRFYAALPGKGAEETYLASRIEDSNKAMDEIKSGQAVTYEGRKIYRKALNL